VPGIGKRTAERIIVELREKVGEGDSIVVMRADDPRTLARDGLVGLGFSIQEAEKLLATANGDSAEELIEGALRARAAAA
jgi:holliday junction DNA helicase RuvA